MAVLCSATGTATAQGLPDAPIFQLTFSNGLGTTLAQVARGGTARDDWYIGFNLSRKFY